MSAFAVARQSLRATGERPEAAILLGLAIFGAELLLLAVAQRALGSELLLRWLLHGEPPRAFALGAILAAGLPLAMLLGVVTALGAARIARRPLGLGSACSAAATLALGSLTGIAGAAAIAAGTAAALGRGLAMGQSLGGAALFALLAGPGLLVVGASLAATLLALGRIGGEGDDRIATIGAALADLLLDPARSARRIGALWLCALPFFVLALLCGGSALLAGSSLARLALQLAHTLSAAFGLLWLARGSSLVIGRTEPQATGPRLGAPLDRC